MSRHNNAEVADRLRRFTQNRGIFVADTVAPEIVPVVQVADLSLDPRGGKQIYAGAGSSRSAAASNYQHSMLYNPDASGRDLVVELVAFGSGSGGTSWQIGAFNDTTGATQAATTRITDRDDQRNFGWMTAEDPVGQVWVWQDTNVEPTARFAWWWLAPSTHTQQFNPRTRLEPGAGLLVACATVNASAYVSYSWREILLV